MPRLADPEPVASRDEVRQVVLVAVDIQDAEANVDDGFGAKSRYGGGADVIRSTRTALTPRAVRIFARSIANVAGQVGSGGTTLMSRFSTPPISSTGFEGSAALISPTLGLHHRGRVVWFDKRDHLAAR